MRWHELEDSLVAQLNTLVSVNEQMRSDLVDVVGKISALTPPASAVHWSSSDAACNTEVEATFWTDVTPLVSDHLSTFFPVVRASGLSDTDMATVMWNALSNTDAPRIMSAFLMDSHCRRSWFCISTILAGEAPDHAIAFADGKCRLHRKSTCIFSRAAPMVRRGRPAWGFELRRTK